MPSHKAHRFIKKLAYNRTGGGVDAFIDRPYAVLIGKHRILRHSLAELAAKYPDRKDDQKLQEAVLHLFADGELNERRLIGGVDAGMIPAGMVKPGSGEEAKFRMLERVSKSMSPHVFFVPTLNMRAGMTDQKERGRRDGPPIHEREPGNQAIHQVC